MKKKIGSVLLCLLICCSVLFAVPAFAEGDGDGGTRVLTVAFPEAEEFNEVHEDGVFGSSTYDCLMEVAKYTGWEYEFITGDVDVLSEGMMRGEYDLMGGELKVESEAGVGSEFYFTINLPVWHGAQPEPRMGKASIPLEGMRVLLAEDNDLNAEIAISLLEIEGIEADRAVNRFLERPAGWYGLILMDIQMPVKDGLAAAREVRALDRPDAQRIPIVAMMANTIQEDREKAAAGMNGFIPKPFEVEQLYQALRQAKGSGQ